MEKRMYVMRSDDGRFLSKAYAGHAATHGHMGGAPEALTPDVWKAKLLEKESHGPMWAQYPAIGELRLSVCPVSVRIDIGEDPMVRIRGPEGGAA